MDNFSGGAIRARHPINKATSPRNMEHNTTNRPRPRPSPRSRTRPTPSLTEGITTTTSSSSTPTAAHRRAGSLGEGFSPLTPTPTNGDCIDPTSSENVGHDDYDINRSRRNHRHHHHHHRGGGALIFLRRFRSVVISRTSPLTRKVGLGFGLILILSVLIRVTQWSSPGEEGVSWKHRGRSATGGGGGVRSWSSSVSSSTEEKIPSRYRPPPGGGRAPKEYDNNRKYQPLHVACYFHDDPPVDDETTTKSSAQHGWDGIERTSHIIKVYRLNVNDERYPSKRIMEDITDEELDKQEDIRTNSKQYRRGKGDEFETDECKAQHEWQLANHPICNGLHEFDLRSMNAGTKVDRREDELVRLLDNGYWRDVWTIKEYDRTTKQVLKTLRYNHEYEERNYERHRRDAIAMEQLTSSPHVVDVYGYCGNSGLFEYSNGGDISDALWPRSGDTLLNKLDKLHVATQVAIGIADMHNVDREGTASIAHTDITPGQFILIDGFFKLNDFNRCRFIRWHTKEDRPCTYTVGRNPGKYRSPEEYKYKEQTEKVDVYSMGNILYSLLTERWPFEGMDEKEAKKLVMNGERPIIQTDIRNSTDPIYTVMVKGIELCWTQDMKERASAREVANYLARNLRRLDPELKE